MCTLRIVVAGSPIIKKYDPSCIFWRVWIERIRRCFNGISTLILVLKGRCLLLLFSWTNYVPVNGVGSFVDLFGSLSLAQ